MFVLEIGIFDKHEGGGNSRLFKRDVGILPVKHYLAKVISNGYPKMTAEELASESDDIQEMLLAWQNQINHNMAILNQITDIQSLHNVEIEPYSVIKVSKRKVY